MHSFLFSLHWCELYLNAVLSAFQEVQRIKNEHPDDACALLNDRVKGSLKVTRAFGAGFLKQVWSQFKHSDSFFLG
jgi:hypothetical protein